MARPRTVLDADVYAAIRRLTVTGGDKAISFQSIAQDTGLAAPTLVQRYGSRDSMVQSALLDGWDVLDAAVQHAAEQAEPSPKGAQAMLKALAETAPDLAIVTLSLRDAYLRARAENWRGLVESALAPRLGGGAQGRDAAAMLFAAWQGQLMWAHLGGKGFRLKDALRRLT